MSIVFTVVQLLIMSLFVYIISGRLLGTKLNFFKRFFSTVMSVALTTFVMWYSYFRHSNYLERDVVQQFLDTSTFIWFGSMLFIAMLFYLIFELFDPKQQSDFSENSDNFFMRARSNYYRNRRFAQVFRIAFKQGIGKALQYKRSFENDRYIAIILRNIMEDAGGIFVKFGQVLSTRTDILPTAFIEEFSKLQQNVKPMSVEEVERILKYQLDDQLPNIFQYFNEQPLAAGSIGQVHRAQLKENGEEVVVKILRSEVTRVMNKDLDILIHFSAWLEEESAWAENLGFHQLAVGFARSLREEINFDIERQNMQQIANALEGRNQQVRIPKVYAKHSNRHILVMEYIQGVPITQANHLIEQRNGQMEDVLSKVYRAFLEQLLVAGVFHADPHPGNVYIAEKDGQPVFLDFGAVGRLGAIQNQGLRTLLIGIATNDAKVMTLGLENLVTDGELKERAKLEQELSQLLISIQFVSKISTEQLVQRLFEIMRVHELKLYPMVSVALRALITMDGTLSSVNPQFDIFNEAKRFSVEHKKELIPAASVANLKATVAQEVALLLPQLRDLPRRAERVIQHFEKGEMTVKMDVLSDKKTTTFINHWASLFILLVVAVTFGFISVALLAIGQYMTSPYTVYLNTGAYVGLFLSSVILVRLSVQALKYSKRIE